MLHIIQWVTVTTPEQKSKTSKTLLNKKTRTNQFGTFDVVPVGQRPEYVGEYSKIFFCTCKITGIKWVSSTLKQIHPSAIETKKQYGYQCRFTFGISSYPEWFKDSSRLIKEFGWYSTPGSNRRGSSNINGISRDHLYSVSDGYKNKIDPKIISHPANCELEPHKQNQSKGKKSSITLDELMIRIENFDKMHCES